MSNDVVTEGPKFDFITEVSFRISLESDYRELTRCLEAGAWKAVHVLAGSIVEAILTDYLIGVGYQKKTGTDPLKMELGPIISACKDEKIIAGRTADLSAVVRSYRNLIHPGRVIRLNEKIDQRTALIAKGLVEVVADEVAAAKAISYGFTAEQIANKIEKDSGALAVLKHFLKETNERERERLVADVLPQRLFFARDLGDESGGDDYRRCHRQTFDTLPDECKMRVAKKFVKVLKEEAGDFVLAYENHFFSAGDLKYLPTDDAAMVKAHLLSRLERDQGGATLELLDGVGEFLTDHEISRVVDACARALVYGKSETARNRARHLLFMLHFETEGAVQEALKERVDQWIKLADEKGMTGRKVVLEQLKLDWAEDIPF